MRLNESGFFYSYDGYNIAIACMHYAFRLKSKPKISVYKQMPAAGITHYD